MNICHLHLHINRPIMLSFASIMNILLKAPCKNSTQLMPIDSIHITSLSFNIAYTFIGMAVVVVVVVVARALNVECIKTASAQIWFLCCYSHIYERKTISRNDIGISIYPPNFSEQFSFFFLFIFISLWYSLHLALSFVLFGLSQWETKKNVERQEKSAPSTLLKLIFLD